MGKSLEIIFNIFESLKLKEGGYSARKLSALQGAIMASIITIVALIYAYVNKEPWIFKVFLFTWLLYSLVCLGVVTVEQIIKLKSNGTSNTESNNSNGSGE